MKTLKYEEVLRNEYRDLADARASMREFLEKIYNRKRPVEYFSSNGQLCLNCLCQSKGQAHLFMSCPFEIG